MRKFNKSQKQELFILSEGRCSICLLPLLKNWHADHIHPYSKGGKTVVSNGQALCPKCNLKKSNSMEIIPRKWQTDAFEKLEERYKNGKKNALIDACPASGKTKFAIMATKIFPDWNIVVVSPSEEIKRNWSNEFLTFGDKDLDYKYSFKYDYSREFHGISITYQSLNDKNVNFLNRIIDDKTLLICDEIHHAGDNKSWGDAIKSVGDLAGFVLLLTGTPERSDNARIPFCKYEEELTDAGTYKLVTDYSRSYADELEAGNVCPIDFSLIRVKHNDRTIDLIEDSTTGRKVLNAALTPSDNNNFVLDMFADADKKLQEIREDSNAAGLIICKSIDDAKYLHRKLPHAEIVTSDDSEAANKIKVFKRSTKEWLIAVQMIAEGVDISRIRVIVYATNITTRLYFTQVAGRGIRNKVDVRDYCYMYIPRYKPLVDISQAIKDEIIHIVKFLEEKEKREFEKLDGDKTENPYYGDMFAGSKWGYTNNGDTITMEFNDKNIVPIAKKFESPEAMVREVFSLRPKDEDPKRPKTEEVEDVKRQIHKATNRIYHLLDEGVEHRQIGYDLNKRTGVSSTANCKDLGILNRKLNEAKRWIEEILD